MDKPPIRCLTLADLIILVAASAVGVLILRTAHGGRTVSLFGPLVPPWSFQIGTEVSPFLISTAAGLLISRLAQPRPPWRRLFRQPGLVACLVILADLAIGIIFNFGRSWIETLKLPGVNFTFDWYMDVSWSSGMEVALAWTILALARAWRPEPSWIDRAGRCLGGLAIVLWIATRLFL
jgi:hypothetical protein